MDEEKIIAHIIHSFKNYALRDIKRINEYEMDFTIAEFILCSCFIDQISGFRYNTNSVRKRYERFIREYLPQYDSVKLNSDLRNKIVHNYSIGTYALTRKQQNLHLKEIDGTTFLNLEDFIHDLEIAVDKYFIELRHEKTIRKNALEWCHKNKILSLNN